MDKCHRCGYCEHCGRSNDPYPYKVWPYIPMYPMYPTYPWYGQTVTITGSSGNVGFQNENSTFQSGTTLTYKLAQ